MRSWNASAAQIVAFEKIAVRLIGLQFILAVIVTVAAVALLPSALKGAPERTEAHFAPHGRITATTPGVNAFSDANFTGTGSASRQPLSKSESQEAAAAGLLPAGTRSVLRFRGPLRYGQFVWNDQGVPQGQVSVIVDLQRQLISVFRSGHEIGNAVVVYGADGKETPHGTLHVLAKMKDHRSSTYDAMMPYTLRLTHDGVSIHGSDVRWGAATHGCVGVPTEFARLLFAQVAVGQPIQIRK